MTVITHRSDAGVEGKSVMFLRPQSRVAGAAISAGEAAYIDSNGLIQKAVSTANWITTGTFMQSAFDGVPASDIASGSVGELYGRGAVVEIADSGLTIGAPVWITATAGRFGDAKVAANDEPVARVISATQIVLTRGL
jgi:hypothetical protein